MNQETGDQVWMRGYSAAHIGIIENSLRALGYDAMRLAGLVAERERALQVLRELCAQFGDNDWTDDLRLADIMEKHLGNHLWAQGDNK